MSQYCPLKGHCSWLKMLFTNGSIVLGLNWVFCHSFACKLTFSPDVNTCLIHLQIYFGLGWAIPIKMIITMLTFKDMAI